MSLLEFLSPTYAGLGADDLADVGEFVNDIIAAKARGDSEEIDDLLKQALAELSTDPESLDLFYGSMNFIEECGDEQDKVAALGLMQRVTPIVDDSVKTAQFNGAQAAHLGLSAAGVGLAAAPFIAHMHRRRKQEDSIKRSFREILADRPHLKDNPNLARLFQTVVDFAPSVAGNSLVAGNVLDTLHKIGPDALSPRMLGELLSVEKEYAQRPSGAEMLKDTAKSVGDFGDTIRKVRDVAPRPPQQNGPPNGP